MTKILKWRLGKLPTVEELRELVKDKIVTQDEAREILFNLETEEDRDKKSLESEIKFLRELVERLSVGNSTRIVEVIKEVHKPWIQYPWYQPYQYWCTNTTGGYIGTGTYTVNGSTGGGNTNTSATVGGGVGQSSFSSIKTF